MTTKYYRTTRIMVRINKLKVRLKTYDRHFSMRNYFICLGEHIAFLIVNFLTWRILHLLVYSFCLSRDYLYYLSSPHIASQYSPAHQTSPFFSSSQSPHSTLMQLLSIGFLWNSIQKLVFLPRVNNSKNVSVRHWSLLINVFVLNFQILHWCKYYQPTPPWRVSTDSS